MGCCGKKAKQILSKGKAIAVGYANLARGKKYEFTDDRVRTCQKCDKNYWIKRTLWCSICKCFIPAKARVESEKCPEGKWP
jgi:hypothetical protein